MRILTELTPADADAVRRLADAAAASDGIAPLNDDARLALDHADGERHVLVETDGALMAYGIADRHGSAQVVVDPGHRRRGLGRQIVNALGTVAQYWSFGDLAPARAWAEATGLAQARLLLIMQRDLAAYPATPASAEGVTIRAFTDDDLPALLATNAAAFAHHPEQGDLDADHFAALAGTDWFDPADILLAEVDGEIVGFHWTKRHGEGLGEVYVLGVHPKAEGKGLGRLLLDAGLAHLAEVGCDRVVLYVDGAEERPVRLYESARFETLRRDVAWAPPGGHR